MSILPRLPAGLAVGCCLFWNLLIPQEMMAAAPRFQIQVDEDEKKPPDESPMSEMQLMERVAELQRLLGSQKVSQRDAAEKELTQFGPIVLDFIDVADDDVTSDVRERLRRIRQTLEKMAVTEVTRPSRVSISGSLPITEVIKKIKQQTGNDVDLVEGVPDQFADQKISLDLDEVEFWHAIREVMKKSNLVVAPYSGGPGQLRLSPRADPEMQAVAGVSDQEIPIPNDQAGIFDIQVTRIDSTRSLIAPANNHLSLSLKVRWEPRVRPISVMLPMDQVKAVDEFDKPVLVANQEAVISGIVQAEIPELDFNIALQLVDRQVEVIKSFEATINAVLPGRIETFKFKNLGATVIGAEQSKAGVIVGFGGIRKNEDLWGIQLNIGFDEENEATESYQGWIYQNEVFLIDKEGQQHEYIGMESGSQQENRSGVRYYFDVDPAKCTLVYKTPAAIVKLPIKITLTNIPLP